MIGLLIILAINVLFHQLAISSVLVDFSLLLNGWCFFIAGSILYQHLGYERLVKWTAGSIFLTSVGVAIIGILQTMGINIIDLPVVRIPGSTLADRPFAAEYIVGAIPWAILFIYTWRNKTAQLLGILPIAILFLYLILLRGRAGYVAFALSMLFLAASLLLYYAKSIRWKSVLKWTVPIVMLLSIAIYVGDKEYQYLPRKSFQETLLKVYDTSNPRIWYWKTSTEMIKNRPFTGIGMSQWSAEFPQHNGAAYNDKHIYYVHLNPHNDFLEMWAEAGVLAFLFYLFLAFYPLWLLWRNGRKNPIDLLIATSQLALIVAACFSFTKDRTAPMIIWSINLMFSLHIKATTQSKFTFYKNRLLLGISFVLLLNAGYVYQRIEGEKHYSAAMAYKFDSKYAEMLEVLDRIVLWAYPLDPSEIPIQYYQGVGTFHLAQYKEANDYFDEALALKPHFATILLNQASALYKAGKVEEAIIAYEAMKEQFPNYIEPQLNLIAIYTNEEEWEKGADLLKSISRKYHGYRASGIKHEYSLCHSFEKYILNDETYNALKRYYIKNKNELFLEDGVFQYQRSEAVYWLKDGLKHKIKNAEAFKKRGFQWENIIFVPKDVQFPDGEPIQ